MEGLTRRLAETPAEFLAAPGVVRVAAVVNDLIVELGGGPLTTAQAALFEHFEHGLDLQTGRGRGNAAVG